LTGPGCAKVLAWTSERHHRNGGTSVRQASSRPAQR